MPSNKQAALIPVTQVENLRPNFWELPLAELTSAEWEALCDGCGRCCVHKFQDIDDDKIYYTDVACKLLNLTNGRCSNYAQRQNHVADCMSLRAEGTSVFALLPHSCAYRIRHQQLPLPEWHPLISGNQLAMQRQGIAVAGRLVSETGLSPDKIEERIIQWID